MADWRDIHHLEQVLCYLTTGPALDAEIENRLLEAEQKSLGGVAARRATLATLPAKLSPAEVEEVKQFLLFSTVVDLQWKALQLYQIRKMRLRAVKTVTWIALGVMILVAIPLLAYLAHFYLLVKEEDSTFISRLISRFPNVGLFTAISFGALGALFSRFIVLQRSEVDVSMDEAGTFYGKRYILLRVLIGVVAAIIVYFFLASQLIGGSLAPNIQNLTFIGAPIRTYLGGKADAAMVPSKDLALLIVWAFLAGLSEILVRDLLSTTEERILAQLRAGGRPPPVPPPAPTPPLPPDPTRSGPGS